jgi:guanylate kinase
MPRGRLLIFSGPSGAGKSTLLRRLLEVAAQPLTMSVSATTRPRRPGEVDGRDYHFLSAEEFARRRRNGEFLECCEVYGRGHWYGTLQSTVDCALDRGQWLVLEIDVEGTRQVVRQYPSAVTFFVKPGDLAELERRLRLRGTEDEQTMQRRLAVAATELAQAADYQHVVVNDTVEKAVRDVCAILRDLGE